MGQPELSELGLARRSFYDLPRQERMALRLVGEDKHSLEKISIELRVTPDEAADLIMSGFCRWRQSVFGELQEHSAIAHAHDAAENLSTLQNFVGSLACGWPPQSPAG